MFLCFATHSSMNICLSRQTVARWNHVQTIAGFLASQDDDSIQKCVFCRSLDPCRTTKGRIDWIRRVVDAPKFFCSPLLTLFDSGLRIAGARHARGQ
jgi:hypothetical protein